MDKLLGPPTGAGEESKEGGKKKKKTPKPKKEAEENKKEPEEPEKDPNTMKLTDLMGKAKKVTD